MKARKSAKINACSEPGNPGGPELLRRLLDKKLGIPASEPNFSVVIGELISLTNDGCTPLVVFPAQIGSAAVHANSCVELFAADIGKRVVLTFENGDAAKPIVMGLLRDAPSYARKDDVKHSEVEADGERLIVSAKRQLTLRCGEASITLTREGKVIIQGTFVATRSSGVNRIVGGSVQIN